MPSGSRCSDFKLFLSVTMVRDLLNYLEVVCHKFQTIHFIVSCVQKISYLLIKYDEWKR